MFKNKWYKELVRHLSPAQIFQEEIKSPYLSNIIDQLLNDMIIIDEELFKDKIKKAVKSFYHSLWEESMFKIHLYNLIKNINSLLNKKLLLFKRYELSRALQLMIGNGYIPMFLSKFSERSPLCFFCSSAGSKSHLLFHCLELNYLRSSLCIKHNFILFKLLLLSHSGLECLVKYSNEMYTLVRRLKATT